MKKGFTLIELLVVISIIGLTASVVLVSVSTARSKSKYTDTISQFKQIESAAELDNIDFGSYAPDTDRGVAPRFVPGYLPVWPTPPCSGWSYDWDNWHDGGKIRISLLDADGGQVYFYCVAVFPPYTNCGNGYGTLITDVADKMVTCSEEGV